MKSGNWPLERTSFGVRRVGARGGGRQPEADRARPRARRGLHALAKCLRERGDAKPAEALYRRVLELDSKNRIAGNYLSDLKAERDSFTAVDVDNLAAVRALARTGIVRGVTDTELRVLAEACRGVPPVSGDYQQTDYITNVLLTVLDLGLRHTLRPLLRPENPLL